MNNLKLAALIFQKRQFWSKKPNNAVVAIFVQTVNDKSTMVFEVPS